MTWIDWFIVAVLALSVGFGVWRGLVREVFALAGWIAAFALSAWLGSSVATWLPVHWGETARSAAGHVAVFVLVLIFAALAGWAVSGLLRAVGLGVADRSFGGVFGALRGVLIILAATILAGLTQLPKTDAWKSSGLMPYVRIVLDTVRPWLPEGAARVVQTVDGRATVPLRQHQGVELCAESLA